MAHRERFVRTLTRQPVDRVPFIKLFGGTTATRPEWEAENPGLSTQIDRILQFDGVYRGWGIAPVNYWMAQRDDLISQYGLSTAVIRPWGIIDADRMVTTDGSPATGFGWGTIDRRDVASALVCALETPGIAYECLHITATPGGYQATDAALSEQRLGWRAAHRFDAGL